MKKTALLRLLVTVAVLATALLPISVLAAAGDLYEADFSSDTINKFTPAGVLSNPPFASGLNGPFGLAFDSSGNLFEADTSSGTIFKFTSAGTQSTFASGLSGTKGLAFDSSGNLFEADQFSGTIFKFTPDGIKTTFASGLSGPVGLAFDSSGNLFEADFSSGTIFKFTPDGSKSTFASGLNGPVGLAFDSSGNLFEADYNSGTINKFTPAGVPSNPPFASGLSNPTGLAFDSSGNLFEADQGSGTIFMFTPAGIKSTFASGLNGPSGLAFLGGLASSSSSTVHLANISTRAFVQTGDNVLIGGFVISGNNPKQVLVRAIGPSLPAGIANRMQDPMISLHDSTTAEIDSNDDWQSHPNASQIPMQLQPGDPRESAILTTLQPGAYTAIVSGKGGTTGVALVEVYDMDTVATSELINISTRGPVQTGDFVMIGGFVPTGTSNIEVLIRAIGPSFAAAGIPNPLPDPTVTVFNANGNIIGQNDNWRDNQEAEILATGKAPTNNLESAVILNLAPGSGYTAIVSDKNGASGVGLVEVFKLQ
jgi:sugar lactone lactonase YvrE